MSAMTITDLTRLIVGRQCRVRVAGTWYYAPISHGAATVLHNRLGGRITVDLDTDPKTAYLAVARGAEEADA